MITCPTCRHQLVEVSLKTSGGSAVCEKCKQLILICPDCEHQFDHEPDTIGEIVSCDNCGAELLITGLKPIKFELLDAEK